MCCSRCNGPADTAGTGDSWVAGPAGPDSAAAAATTAGLVLSDLLRARPVLSLLSLLTLELSTEAAESAAALPCL